MVATSAFSLTSRTVPMNAATAPIARFPARSAPSSRATSKSSTWTRTGTVAPPAPQPPVTGGNSATSSPGRIGVSGSARSWLTAMRTARPGASSAAQAPPRVASHARSAATVVTLDRRFDALARRAEGFAQPGEVDERESSGGGVAHAGLRCVAGGGPGRARREVYRGSAHRPARRTARLEAKLDADADLVGLRQARAEFAERSGRSGRTRGAGPAPSSCRTERQGRS